MTINYNLAEAVSLVHVCFATVEAATGGSFDDKLMEGVLQQAFNEHYPCITRDQLSFVIQAAMCDIEGQMEELGIRPSNQA
jgi:hypothetical protein